MIELYKYQKSYLENLPSRAIMAADTGTGKTFMALQHYQEHGDGQPLLILAPASKIRTGDWERDVTEFFGEGNEPHYEIYSYEKFSRMPSWRQMRDKGQQPIYERFAPSKGGEQWAVIADECHRAKNPQSGIGKAVYLATQYATFFVGLSATPLPNGWIDFANYSKIWGFTKHITHFKRKYCNIQTFRGFPEIMNYWRVDELTRQWQSISKPLPKDLALDLPPRVFIPVSFKKPTEYVTTLISHTNSKGKELDTPSALSHALRQTLTAPKLDYLMDLLEGTNDNVVVFYNYISERNEILKALKKKLPRKKVFRQDGQKHELPSKSEWSGITDSVTLAHYKSGATGVEMTYANIVVYFSPTYSYAEYMQSIGRVYRNGQTSKTTFYNFKTVNSIEDDVYNCLKNKSDFQVAIWKAPLR